MFIFMFDILYLIHVVSWSGCNDFIVVATVNEYSFIHSFIHSSIYSDFRQIATRETLRMEDAFPRFS